MAAEIKYWVTFCVTGSICDLFFLVKFVICFLRLKDAKIITGGIKLYSPLFSPRNKSYSFLSHHFKK